MNSSKQGMSIKFLDFLISIIILIFCSPIMLVMFFLGFFFFQNPFFLNKRLGLNKKPFFIIKFRSLPIGTPIVPTHELSKPSNNIYGNFIRKTKLDELPQFINVLLGSMSIVGPRPCLLSQSSLISLREKNNLFSIKPGITGVAQIEKIDMNQEKLLVKKEKEMVRNNSLKNYLNVILRTIMVVSNSFYDKRS